MKRIVCLLLAVCLLGACLTACGQAQPQPQKEPQDAETVKENDLPKAPEAPETPETAEAAEAVKTPAEGEFPSNDIRASQVVTGERVLENVSFVVAYDPFIYKEKDEEEIRRTTLFSGDMSDQIVTGLHRAGELEAVIPEIPNVTSQTEINKGFDFSEVNRAAGRAGGQDPIYEKGDTHVFFCFDSTASFRIQEEFTCVYEGEHCYIWSLNNSIGEADGAQVAAEFDGKIFDRDTTYFGTPRFTENGGKVNVLFYPMPEGLCGFFCTGDIYSSLEAPQSVAERYKLNTDHAIININSKMLGKNMPEVYSTLAHELQHQICATEAFYYVDSPFVQMWLDEAMAACAEELCYPGIKIEGYYNLLMYFSDNFRKGQSLYNFENETDEFIGAYGAVYLFEEYLTQHAGEDVFSKIHNYWKTSYRSDVTEAQAIYASVPQSFIDESNEKYSFPASISAGFQSPEEEWMSKMTLDFYLEAISPELGQLMSYTDKARISMLYSEVNPLDIQGGGRVIVACENGSFTIPDDAGKGLIFIGLDKNFNVVTEVYTNAR